MSDASKQEIKLFYCYAREDKVLREELEIHLSGLKRQYHLINWSDREILPGDQWDQTIDTHINMADIILLLISPHFLASDYCNKEMQRALQRLRQGYCQVIPILLRPTYWEDTPFSEIQLLPTDAKPITSWADRYEAFHDVVKSISSSIKRFRLLNKTKGEWFQEGETLFESKLYEEALTAYNEAIRLDPINAEFHNRKGIALRNLKRYEEALTAYDQAILLIPSDSAPYNNKGLALSALKRFEQALAAFDEAIRLDPTYARTYSMKGIVLRNLERYEEALAAYNEAIRLDPAHALTYYNKGIALEAAERHAEAKQAYKQARLLGYKD